MSKTKFRSRIVGEPVRIASTSGHICIIGDEFVDVPGHMVSDAYAAGAISEDMYNSIRADIEKEQKAAAAIDRPAVVDAKLQEMLDSDDKGYFTTQGIPNRKILNKLCAFTVSNDEFELAWNKVITERDTKASTGDTKTGNVEDL